MGQGSNRNIATISANITTDVSGWTSGLKQCENSVDKFYAGVNAKIAKSPFGQSIKGVGDFSSAFKDLGASAFAPLDGIRKKLEGVSQVGSHVLDGIGKIGIGLASVGAAGAAGLAAMTTGGIDRIDQLTDAAQRIGVTTEALSELRYAANLSGSSAEDLDAALEKLNQNLGDSLTKANPTSEALERIGLSAKDLAKSSPDEAFTKIIGAFESIPDAATKASIATDLFGKGGLKLVNTLGSGTKAIEDLREEAKRLGVSVSQIDAAKIASAKDAMDRVGAAAQGVGNTLAIKLAPYIEKAATLFVDWFSKVWDGGKIIDTVLDGFANGLGFVIDTVSVLKLSFSDMFAEALQGIGKLMQKTGQYLEMTKGLNSSLGTRGVDLQNSGSSLEAQGQNMQRANEKARKAFETALPSEALAKQFQSFKDEATATATAAADAIKTKLDGARGSVLNLAGSISGLTSKLKEQIETFGMSSSELEIYKLKQQGATEAQLKDVAALDRQLKAKEEAKKGNDDLMSFSKDLNEKLKSPLEKYRDEAIKIGAAVSKGLISGADADKARGAAMKDAGLMPDVKLSAAADVNSSAAYSSVVSALSGKADGFSNLEKIGNAQTTIQGQINAGIQSLLKKLDPKPEIAI